MRESQYNHQKSSNLYEIGGFKNATNTKRFFWIWVNPSLANNPTDNFKFIFPCGVYFREMNFKDRYNSNFLEWLLRGLLSLKALPFSVSSNKHEIFMFVPNWIAGAQFSVKLLWKMSTNSWTSKLMLMTFNIIKSQRFILMLVRQIKGLNVSK